MPARKDPDEVYDDERLGPGDRLNIVFSSSVITKGRGKAIVFATGMSTEIGAIAAALGEEGGKKRVLKRDENGKASIGAYIVYGLGKTWDWIGEFLGLTVGTPLQRKLSQLFYYIFLFAVVCAIIVLAANEVCYPSISVLRPRADSNPVPHSQRCHHLRCRCGSRYSARHADSRAHHHHGCWNQGHGGA